jgi:hypothetical protein
MATKTSTPLAPIIKTRMHKRFIRRGTAVTEKAECWGAETADGVWAFDREDSSGTPWLIIHKASRIMVSMGGNLRSCRAYVAAGHAQRDLERLQAHERGEHNDTRDSWCNRC